MRLERSLWVVLLGALIVLPNLFALTQLRATGGFLFYSNAFDEPTYLSYDGALMTRSVTHSAEHLVVWLHRAGLSGGYINFGMDLLIPLLTVIALRALARRLGFSALESAVYPFVVVAVPVLFGYADPYYGRFYDYNFYSAGLKWLTLPQAYYPPSFRSPEPQLSLLAAATVTLLAVRWRSYWPPLLIAPLLYPFVGIPIAFVTLGLMLCDRRAPLLVSVPTPLAALLSYVAVAVAVTMFYLLFIRNTGLADFLPQTRLPLISGTGVAALILCAVMWPRLEPALRKPALFLALAPNISVNTQVLSGFFETPHNFEQNFGVVAVAILIVLALRSMGGRLVTPSLAAAAASVLLWMYSAHIFLVNSSIWQRVPPSAELIDHLRRDASAVVIADPDLADIFSLIAPRVHFSALAHAQVLRSETPASGAVTTAERFAQYLCTRTLIRSHDLKDVVPERTFATLDRGFEFLAQDFPLIHLHRRAQFTRYFDPVETPTHCPARQLFVFPSVMVRPMGDMHDVRSMLAKDGQWELHPEGATLVTPPAQWSHASMAPLPLPVPGNRQQPRLVDARITLTIERGCLDLGVMEHDRRAFLQNVAVLGTGAPQTRDLVFNADTRGQWLVVRNCSPDGQSRATFGRIEVFGVDAVTVRPVSAGVASSS